MSHTQWQKMVWQRNSPLSLFYLTALKLLYPFILLWFKLKDLHEILRNLCQPLKNLNLNLFLSTILKDLHKILQTFANSRKTLTRSWEHLTRSWNTLVRSCETSVWSWLLTPFCVKDHLGETLARCLETQSQDLKRICEVLETFLRANQTSESLKTYSWPQETFMSKTFATFLKTLAKSQNTLVKSWTTFLRSWQTFNRCKGTFLHKGTVRTNSLKCFAQTFMIHDSCICFWMENRSSF